MSAVHSQLESVCLQGRGPDMTITDDALDVTKQGSSLGLLCTGIPSPTPSGSDIWLSRPETCSNLCT